MRFIGSATLEGDHPIADAAVGPGLTYAFDMTNLMHNIRADKTYKFETRFVIIKTIDKARSASNDQPIFCALAPPMNGLDSVENNLFMISQYLYYKHDLMTTDPQTFFLDGTFIKTWGGQMRTYLRFIGPVTDYVNPRLPYFMEALISVFEED